MIREAQGASEREGKRDGGEERARGREREREVEERGEAESWRGREGGRVKRKLNEICNLKMILQDG